MRVIDSPSNIFRDSFSLTEAINRGLAHVNNPELLEVFERSFPIKPQEMLSFHEKIELSDNIDGLDDSRSVHFLFESMLPNFFLPLCIEKSLRSICFLIDQKHYFTYVISNDQLKVTRQEDPKSDLYIATTLETFSAYLRHKLYYGAALINDGMDEEKVFEIPLGLTELNGQQMDMVVGGFNDNCGWAIPGTADMCPTLTDDPPEGCPGVYGCAAQGAGPCNSNGCVAQGCPADICGNDACGANACAADACGVNLCARDACTNDACAADACGSNTCIVDFCGANACGADVCAIDLGIPGDACPANGCFIDTPIPGPF